MRTLRSSAWLALLLPFALAACIGEYTPGPSPTSSQPTTTTTPTSTAPAATSAPSSSDGGTVPGDMGGGSTGSDGGAAAGAFGATCATGTDCQSGICVQVNMGLHCTVACTNLGGADNACPLPGGAGSGGQCNQNGYCKVQ